MCSICFTITASYRKVMEGHLKTAQHLGRLCRGTYLLAILTVMDGQSFAQVASRLIAMKPSDKRGVPQPGPSFGASRKRATPCSRLGMIRASRRGDPLTYTWARHGQPPRGKTSGKRTGYQGCGPIISFSGRFFYQGQEGRVNSAAYMAFLIPMLPQTTQPLVLMQEGAKYPTNARVVVRGKRSPGHTGIRQRAAAMQ